MSTLLQTLLVLILLPGFQNTATNGFSPRLTLKPRIGSVFVAPNQDARSAFESLAERAGLNVLFHPDFQQDELLTMRIENVDVFEALDQLSAQTGNFWVPWDGRTLIVAPEGQRYRRELEPVVLKTVYLGRDTPQDAARNLATGLRTLPGVRVFWSDWGKGFVIVASPSNMLLAEKRLADAAGGGFPLPSSAPVSYPEGNQSLLAVLEKEQVRRFVPSTVTSLEKRLPESLTIDTTDTPRAIYQDLAARSGLNVLFDRSFREGTASRFRVDGVRFLDALDLLGLQSSTIWQPLNESTILVTQDSAQNRRDRVAMLFEVIYLPNAASEANLFEAMNILRAALSLRNVYQSPKDKAILVKGTPQQTFLAEKLIADLARGEPRPAPVQLTPPTSSLLAETGWLFRNAEKARPLLDVKLRSRATIHLNGTPRELFEEVVRMGGLEVLFESGSGNGLAAAFNLTSVDILDALDLLAVQTGHLWQVVDAHTIRVSADTQQERQRLLPIEERIVYPPASTPETVNATINVLRTVLSLRDVHADERNRIVIRDIAENLMLAERVVEILGVPPAQP